MQRQFWCVGHMSPPFGHCHRGRLLAEKQWVAALSSGGPSWEHLCPLEEEREQISPNNLISPCPLTRMQSKTVLSLQYIGRYSPEQNTMDCFSVLPLPLCVTPQKFLPFCQQFNLFTHVQMDTGWRSEGLHLPRGASIFSQREKQQLAWMAGQTLCPVGEYQTTSTLPTHVWSGKYPTAQTQTEF